jgi:diguanylate cyclase (GGDEF)-like protein
MVRTRTGGTRWLTAARAQWLIAAAVMVALLVPLTTSLLRQPERARAELRSRWTSRTASAGTFVSAWLDDVAERESSQAARLLADPTPDAEQFDDLVHFFGFQAAVLIDGNGRLLQIAPNKPELLGTDVAARYDHLRQALAGKVGVSAVVPSAAENQPVAAVAVPFDTAAGRRVFSGAYKVGEGPIGAFLASASPLTGNRFWLVDQRGEVVTGTSKVGVDELHAALRADLHGLTNGTYRGQHGDVVFAVAEVHGAPWRMVSSVPSDVLYTAVGDGWLLTWLTVGVLAAAGVFILGLIGRLSSRERQFQMLSQLDPLTGLPNRRSLDDQLRKMVSGARRHGHALSILMIDIDHFKAINDTRGHEGGDAVLTALGALLPDTLRTEDVAGRWGGEEFLAVLPFTHEADAVRAANRLRDALAAGGSDMPTLSIGVSTLHADDDVGSLVARADAALYRAKDGGRDRVCVGRAASMSDA